MTPDAASRVYPLALAGLVLSTLAALVVIAVVVYLDDRQGQRVQELAETQPRIEEILDHLNDDLGDAQFRLAQLDSDLYKLGKAQVQGFKNFRFQR